MTNPYWHHVIKKRLHAFDATNAGTEKIMIRTVDTDVVVISKIQFSWFIKDKYQFYHGIVLLLFYIVLLCLRYLWLFLFFSKQVLDCLITCKWRSYRFGTGKTQRYIPLHKLVCSLRPKHTSLPLIHAITGSDQVSFFAAKGKKTCWKTWGTYDELYLSLNGKVCRAILQLDKHFQHIHSGGFQNV